MPAQSYSYRSSKFLVIILYIISACASIVGVTVLVVNVYDDYSHVMTLEKDELKGFNRFDVNVPSLKQPVCLPIQKLPGISSLDYRDNAYKPSKTSLDLLEEQNRTIKPENFEWDLKLIPSLTDLCLKVLADNFSKRQEYHNLEERDQIHIQELISTDLELDIVVPRIESEQYWQRRYQAHFSQVPLQPHLGWTWKCLYLEQHIRNLIENAEPQYKDEKMFAPTLKLCYTHIHMLSIKQLTQWKKPNTLLAKELPKEDPIYHISFVPILKYLEFLIQLEICFGMNNLGDNYDPRAFQIDPEDCDKLGEAVAILKHLKVFKLHKSEIECKHVKALMRKLVNNTSLMHLDLSYNKIGDYGAKCIAMFLNIHDHLESLILRNNKIGEIGILGLGYALLLPEGARIKILDLSANPLGFHGCKALMRFLVRGTIPSELYVSQCDFDDHCAGLFAWILPVNTSLRKLDLSVNKMGHKGGEKLLEAVQNNSKLVQLDLRDTGIFETTKYEIKMILQKNYLMSPWDSRASKNVLFVDYYQNMLDLEQNNVEKNFNKLKETSSPVKSYTVGFNDYFSNSSEISEIFFN